MKKVYVDLENFSNTFDFDNWKSDEEDLIFICVGHLKNVNESVIEKLSTRNTYFINTNFNGKDSSDRQLEQRIFYEAKENDYTYIISNDSYFLLTVKNLQRLGHKCEIVKTHITNEITPKSDFLRNKNNFDNPQKYYLSNLSDYKKGIDLQKFHTLLGHKKELLISKTKYKQWNKVMKTLKDFVSITGNKIKIKKDVKI